MPQLHVGELRKRTLYQSQVSVKTESPSRNFGRTHLLEEISFDILEIRLVNKMNQVKC